ncbi:PhnA domain-containing protein [Zeaxanthinibacter sp. PT1]|uniref:PhnA domain-containing protein n=1 Tax=Zeaxanthinibacter TaxID=561554 RepID=UPI002349CBE5|nr:alkylphosphonate utilization protein [Zeaxanthinibacter sp. PT1]MDC6350243.1 PhnA domain-containing protein [Zeaxanthinibacter sp. PT1]
MSVKKELEQRSGAQCELCKSAEQLQQYLVPPKSEEHSENFIICCTNCFEQIEDRDKMQADHWRGLSESMWSEVDAVKVVAWRMLNRLKEQAWALDLLQMFYMEPGTEQWARNWDELKDEQALEHLDTNGALLSQGDQVVLIKDLNVKGAGFTAKRGTAVRNISLVHDNAECIEGKVNGQQIVILTKYVKKSG